MYYPKNKIKTNLYANIGEFVYSNDLSPFSGYYYSLYNGKFFEGKSPTKNNKQIIPSSQALNSETDPVPENKPNYLLDSDNPTTSYIVISGQSRKLPTSYYPQPTEQDYRTGQFRRYFCRKVNENIFLEINKTDYEALFNQDPNYVFSLYIPFYLYWYLTGDKDQTAIINKRVTLQAQQLLELSGLDKFIERTGGYLKFYK